MKMSLIAKSNAMRQAARQKQVEIKETEELIDQKLKEIKDSVNQTNCDNLTFLDLDSFILEWTDFKFALQEKLFPVSKHYHITNILT